MKIPHSLIGAVSPILADHYTHATLDALFMQHGFPGEPPTGRNKIDKASVWMREANNHCDDALDRFGNLVGEMMDAEYSADDPFGDVRPDPRARVNAALAKEGLSYHRGGLILGAGLSGPTRSLAELLKRGGAAALEREYDRAYKSIDSDPEAAVTAACAILESLCQTYLDETGVPMPSSLTLGPLWNATAKQLGLAPGNVADDDLKRILSGLYGVADGVAALRTHQGSAHGRSAKLRYRLMPRHARLAVHAAHTMAMFVLETWEARKSAAMPPVKCAS